MAELKCNWCGGNHLGNVAGEACALYLKKRCREIENQWIQAEMIINAIGSVLDAESVSDFELSFPIVRKAADVYYYAKKGGYH